MAAANATLEEIVVTAQKRAENQQMVPISMATVGEAQLKAGGVTSLEGVQRFAPGLTIASYGAAGFVSYTYIRGNGTNQPDSGGEPSVAFFQDEVYLGGTAGMQFDLFDIERVEVLKGPQGTLFGRNASAGALNIITKTPERAFNASFFGEGGTHGYAKVEGAVTGPIADSEHILYRLAVSAKHRGPITKNLASVDDPDDVAEISGRAQLKFVGESGSYLISAGYTRARDGQAAQFISTANTVSILSPAAAASLPPGERRFRHYYNVAGHQNQDLWNLTGRLEWQLAPSVELTSITAYRNNSFELLQDRDSTIKNGQTGFANERDRTFSQEVRLRGDLGERGFNWLAGAYYYRQETDRFDASAFGADAPFPLAGTTGTSNHLLTIESWALFGQLHVPLADRLALTLGGRYTHDQKESDRTVKPVGLFAGPAYNVTPDASWNAFTPAVTLEYRFSDDAMAFASWKKGFKSGGFQALYPATAALAATPFRPEHSESRELGVKSEWFDRRVRLNISAFHVKYEDLQVDRIVTLGVSRIDNAASAHSKGIDVTSSWLVTPDLRIDASASYQRARYDDYLPFVTAVPLNVAGNHTLRSPDFTGFFGVEYRIPVQDSAHLVARTDVTYQSKLYYDAQNSEVRGLFQPGYGLWNASLTYESSEDWKLGLWIRNISDEYYYQNVLAINTSATAAPGSPRTYGVSLSWRLH